MISHYKAVSIIFYNHMITSYFSAPYCWLWVLHHSHHNTNPKVVTPAHFLSHVPPPFFNLSVSLITLTSQLKSNASDSTQKLNHEVNIQLLISHGAYRSPHPPAGHLQGTALGNAFMTSSATPDASTAVPSFRAPEGTASAGNQSLASAGALWLSASWCFFMLRNFDGTSKL